MKKFFSIFIVLVISINIFASNVTNIKFYNETSKEFDISDSIVHIVYVDGQTKDFHGNDFLTTTIKPGTTTFITYDDGDSTLGEGNGMSTQEIYFNLQSDNKTFDSSNIGDIGYIKYDYGCPDGSKSQTSYINIKSITNTEVDISIAKVGSIPDDYALKLIK